MKHTGNALLVSLFFLLRMESIRGVAQHGHCTDNSCFSLFQEQATFAGAENRCKDYGGHLMTVQSSEANEEVVRLLRGFSGRYWIGLSLPEGKCPDDASLLYGYRWLTANGPPSTFQNWATFAPNCSYKCVSVSADTKSWWQESCDDTEIKGFLCEHLFHEPCQRLVVDAAEDAEYTTIMGFNVSGLTAFPQGTVAVKKPSEFKYICYSKDWLQAPWSCELMNGGCEHRCESRDTQFSCTCPPGQTLRENSVTCAQDDPCAGCQHHCEKKGNRYKCGCKCGYALADDGKGCVDIDECLQKDICGERECMNNKGGYECQCKRDFVWEDGKCISVEICDKCEHFCKKIRGEYTCVCKEGYVVSKTEPNRCEMSCTVKDCYARCIPDRDKVGRFVCYCPHGYIKNVRNGTAYCTDIDECANSNQCEQICTNTFGSSYCSCTEGYILINDYSCETISEGSGSTTTENDSTSSVISPTAIPPYVKTGSVLGIMVFIVICMVSVMFLVYRAQKRCGKLDLPTLRHTDVDIFTLQQVTTEKYKRFPFDKQWKNDFQR